MKTYITNDMSVAAFLLLEGHTITKAEKGGPSGKFVFEFEDAQGLCSKSALKFLTSECSKYDGYLRMLRGMLRNQ